jgi:hypothetical protein
MPFVHDYFCCSLNCHKHEFSAFAMVFVGTKMKKRRKLKPQHHVFGQDFLLNIVWCFCGGTPSSKVVCQFENKEMQAERQVF